MAVETAIILPILVALMMGVWEVGRLIQVSMILNSAAREGARLAAGGTNNGVSMTVAMVQEAVRNHLTAAGFPGVAVSNAVIRVTNLSSNAWTDPGDGQPLDPFTVTVTIPAGEAFDSLHWVACTITGITQLSAQVKWLCANDSEVVVSAGLPL